MCALALSTAWPPGFPLPFGIIQENKHTGSFIILEALIVMPVSIPNQIVKDGGVNDIKETRARVIGRSLLHSITIAFIILPPVGRQEKTNQIFKEHSVTAHQRCL